MISNKLINPAPSGKPAFSPAILNSKLWEKEYLPLIQIACGIKNSILSHMSGDNEAVNFHVRAINATLASLGPTHPLSIRLAELYESLPALTGGDLFATAFPMLLDEHNLYMFNSTKANEPSWVGLVLNQFLIGDALVRVIRTIDGEQDKRGFTEAAAESSFPTLITLNATDAYRRALELCGIFRQKEPVGMLSLLNFGEKNRAENIGNLLSTVSAPDASLDVKWIVKILNSLSGGEPRQMPPWFDFLVSLRFYAKTFEPFSERGKDAALHMLTNMLLANTLGHELYHKMELDTLRARFPGSEYDEAKAMPYSSELNADLASMIHGFRRLAFADVFEMSATSALSGIESKSSADTAKDKAWKHSNEIKQKVFGSEAVNVTDLPKLFNITGPHLGEIASEMLDDSRAKPNPTGIEHPAVDLEVMGTIKDASFISRERMPLLEAIITTG